MAKKTKRADFQVSGGGTIYLLTPISKAAREWANDHLPADAQTLGAAIAAEHRYIGDIVNGIQGDGLTVN